MKTIIVGLDIAKSIFQVHIEDDAGRVVQQKRLRRSQMWGFFRKLPPALIGLEACGTAHYWGRELQALGHEVRLIPAAYVKPFVRRNKTDARDAAAICVALGRPDMRFVAVKSPEQQALRGLERSRQLLVKQRTQLMNALRAQMAEHGVIAAQGLRGYAGLVAKVEDEAAALPETLRLALRLLASQVDALTPAIAKLNEQIAMAVRGNTAMRRLMTIPGVGPHLAHAIVAAVGDGRHFASARDFAAWCGLTPRQQNSAETVRGRKISRQGDIRLRQLFALGAAVIMRNARHRPDRATDWQGGILARRPMKVAVLAQAAKTARIAWAVLTSGQDYRPPKSEGAHMASPGAPA
jgi:transposase